MTAAQDTGDLSARKRTWRAGRLRAWIVAFAIATLLPLLCGSWGRPGLVDPSPDAPWPLRSLLSVEAWPAGELPPDKYPEAWHLVAGVAQQCARAFWLTDAEEAQLRELRSAMAAAVAANGAQVGAAVDPTVALQSLGAGFETGAWKLVVAGRTATLLMVVVLLIAVAEIAMAAAGPRFGWVAALAIALQPAVVHYGATLNTDVPALAWSALAWALLVAGRVPPGAARVVAAGAALGLAAATKDQYAAMAPAIALLAWRRGAGRVTSRPLRFGALALGAAASYVATSGLLNHFTTRDGVRASTWRAHVDHLFGAGSAPFRVHDLTPGGIAGLLDDVFERLLTAAGLVSTIGLVLLLVVAVLRRRPRALLLALPGAAYVACFLAPAGYVYPRFTLPLGLCGALGLAWGLRHAHGARTRQRVVVAALALCFAAAEASEVIGSRRGDARPRSVAELAARRGPDDEVWICSEPWLYAPFPPIASPTRCFDLRAMGAAVRDGTPPPRWLWYAAARDSAEAQDEMFASMEKRLRMKRVATFEPEASGRLAADPAGLLLPRVVLFERSE